jgi:hypothetical protein
MPESSARREARLVKPYGRMHRCAGGRIRAVAGEAFEAASYLLVRARSSA